MNSKIKGSMNALEFAYIVESLRLGEKTTTEKRCMEKGRISCMKCANEV